MQKNSSIIIIFCLMTLANCCIDLQWWHARKKADGTQSLLEASFECEKEAEKDHSERLKDCKFTSNKDSFKDVVGLRKFEESEDAKGCQGSSNNQCIYKQEDDLRVELRKCFKCMGTKYSVCLDPNAATTSGTGISDVAKDSDPCSCEPSPCIARAEANGKCCCEFPDVKCNTCTDGIECMKSLDIQTRVNYVCGRRSQVTGGYQNILIGDGITLQGWKSVAIGNGNFVHGNDVFLEGQNNNIKGHILTIVGDNNVQNGGNVNMIRGFNNTLSGSGSIVFGRSNNVNGNSLTVRGTENFFHGHEGSCNGDANYITGNGHSVDGDRNKVTAHHNRVRGNDNSVSEGFHNSVTGNSNTLKGHGNVLKGNNIVFSGHNNKNLG